MTEPTSTYVTIPEAASLIGVSRAFISKCIHQTRTLPAVRVPGTRVVRIRRDDVLALVEPV
ncbi:helix-turn-helix transcriptional regulator [Gordonia zhenghanii]|uniref:helix-turn-helix transcriptional regulator n=1 Tax=Gordonia zhenghanii TaxID=2911516 RepID=UPI0035585CB7